MTIPHARRILLCLRYGIGDLVMELPVIEALRRCASRARITALGAPPAIELLEGDPRVDAVVGIGRWGLRHRWDDGTPRERRRFAAWLAEHDFDLILDAHHAAPGVSRVIRESGTPTVESDEAAETAAVRAGGGGVAAIVAAVRAGWGIEVQDSPSRPAWPRLESTPAERERAREFLKAHGFGDPPFAISPVASLPMKRWPVERFAAAADRLIERTDRGVLLLVGPQRETGDAVLAAMRRTDRVMTVGPLHLRATAARIAQCAAIICNDTGLMHLAAAVGTPVIGIFGPTAPEIYRPPASHAVALVGAEIRCPHRNAASLQPPGCWTSSRCLIAERSCVWEVSTNDVVAAALRAAETRAGRVNRRRPAPPARPGPLAA